MRACFDAALVGGFRAAIRIDEASNRAELGAGSGASSALETGWIVWDYLGVWGRSYYGRNSVYGIVACGFCIFDYLYYRVEFQKQKFGGFDGLTET